MAELVDALVSGTSVRKDVQVRVLFRVQFIFYKPLLYRILTVAYFLFRSEFRSEFRTFIFLFVPIIIIICFVFPLNFIAIPTWC